MSSVHSAHWYRVAALTPRLRAEARPVRHRYRGQVWFVVRDPASGRTHRLSPGARLMLGAMDGTRTVGELWQRATQTLGERAPTQDELIGLMAQLHAADLLQCDVTPDVAEVFQRQQKHERAKTMQSFGNPMSIKLPLLDPTRLLDRLLPLLRPLWNRWGALLWLGVVGQGALLAALHGRELAYNVADQAFALDNLLALGLLFPLIKALHEIGHGVATRMRGGETHEMGVMLLVLMPVPYVDASAASSFRDKRDRALVGAAGMGVELFLAALAMDLWLVLEPGLARAMAFNTMLIAGVSTLVFNGNPLLRYDAYYILADLIEIPNLATRANRWVGAWLQRTLFRADDVDLPPASPGERRWFAFYAPASFVYRTLVSVAIVFYVAGQFFFVGVLLAMWAVTMMVLMPLGRTLRHLATSAALVRVRRRVVLTTAALVGLPLLLLLTWPAPFRSQAEGVVWLPEQSLVRAGEPGFHARFLVQPGQRVRAGDPLAELVNPVLQVQLAVARARVDELRADLLARLTTDRTEADLTREQLTREEAQLADLEARSAALVARARTDGEFVVPQAGDLPGRHFAKGDLLGYVTDPASPRVRVVVQQGEVDIVRLASRQVELRHAWRPDEVVTGTLVREVPGGAAQLPSRALASAGGGHLSTDPRDTQGTRTLQRSFQFDIDLPETGRALYGARVFVRFEHPSEPLGHQWWRSVRQLFLSQLRV